MLEVARVLCIRGKWEGCEEGKDDEQRGVKRGGAVLRQECSQLCLAISLTAPSLSCLLCCSSAKPDATIGINTFSTHRFVFYRAEAGDTGEKPTQVPPEENLMMEWTCDHEEGTRQLVSIK